MIEEEKKNGERKKEKKTHYCNLLNERSILKRKSFACFVCQ